MADITMCMGEGCEIRELCYRYTAPINEYRQNVFTKTPKKEIYEIICRRFVSNENRTDGRKIGKWWKNEAGEPV